MSNLSVVKIDVLIEDYDTFEFISLGLEGLCSLSNST